MIRLELSDEEIEISTHLPEKSVEDTMYCLEEMVREYFRSDIEVDAYITNRADEIFIKNSN